VSAERLASVDSLRGLTVAAMLFVNNPADWQHVYPPFRHAEWHGWTPTDLIFPLFLFIVGVSISLSLNSRIEGGAASAQLRRGIVMRALRLFLLGVGLNVMAYLLLDLRDVRVMAVLQRIAICYAIVAFIAIYTRPAAQWLIAAGLLLGYTALLVLGGSLSIEVNIADRVDAWVLGSHSYEYNVTTGRAHDPEGLLSTLGAIATTLLGVRAGDWLRRGDTRRSLATGFGAVALGALGSLLLPLNKNLWTPSFALLTAGFGFLLVVLFHVLIDRKGWMPAGRSFGVNAIAMFAGSMLLAYVLIGLGLLKPMYEDWLASWLAPLAGPYVSSHAYALLVVLFFWVIARRLDARGIYFKI
jgi:predicted acyltransferase